MKLLSTYFIAILSICIAFATTHAQEGGAEDAASASATGSATAPAKGAPKAAQANSKLRTLHIAVHKLGLSIDDIKTFGLAKLKNTYKQVGGSNFKDHGDLLIKNYSLDDAKTHGDLLRDGYSLDDAKTHGDLLRQGYSLDDAKTYGDDLRAGKTLEEAQAIAETSSALSAANELALSRYASSYSPTSQFESALALATNLLTDRTITDSIGIPISSSTLQSGHNLAFLRILSAYGAFGESGESLASTVLGNAYSGYTDESSIASLLTSTGDYLSFLPALTGERTFASEESSLDLLDISLDNVMLSGSANITLGSDGVDDNSVDVSTYLGKAATSDDRKVLVVGAAKDLTAAGNITFTNSNKVEDHALAIGAADNVMIDGSDITYTGSNLAIASGDTTSDSMYLVNTNISTGGNLAVASLGKVNISSATFSVGTANSLTSDPDNVYIYANDIIDVNNLSFSGRLDDIYMESKTIHIKNTTFPATADVMLRSQHGSLHISNSASDVVAGGVNFHNVKHLGISNSNLVRTQFQGVDGHINSSATLPNGTPFIKIRGQ